MSDTAKFVAEARALCDAFFSDGPSPGANLLANALDSALDIIEGLQKQRLESEIDQMLAGRNAKLQAAEAALEVIANLEFACTPDEEAGVIARALRAFYNAGVEACITEYKRNLELGPYGADKPTLHVLEGVKRRSLKKGTP